MKESKQAFMSRCIFDLMAENLSNKEAYEKCIDKYDALTKEENMPVRGGKDAKGYYYQWGTSGKKYYYTPNDKTSRARARKKAGKQGQAAHASGYKL